MGADLWERRGPGSTIKLGFNWVVQSPSFYISARFGSIYTPAFTPSLHQMVGVFCFLPMDGLPWVLTVALSPRS
jgi:hypothetical protein